jgi:hypothetical protein
VDALAIDHDPLALDETRVDHWLDALLEHLELHPDDHFGHHDLVANQMMDDRMMDDRMMDDRMMDDRMMDDRMMEKICALFSRHSFSLLLLLLDHLPYF